MLVPLCTPGLLVTGLLVASGEAIVKTRVQSLAVAWLTCLVAAASPGVANAHSGGLNGEGCHTNRKTGDYHCHRGGGSASSASTEKPSSQTTRETPARSAGPTCYTGPRGGTYTITSSGRKNYSGC
ncbi:YHYH domain-containing protein [uncultured Ramlibacter sp.]|uniref:YHYH domain-containing protein n=1 Tax=uncultured Ramlibacter sp. TaxID=260755 RepID=UPI002616F5BF|nr:YHYH domain-containing protein [uncultured Ramlibacter sp.]